MAGSSSDRPVLTACDLTVEVRTRAGMLPIVRDISFQVASGEIFAVIGESGSGKSTLARAVVGLLPADARTSGSVRLDGEELNGMPPGARRTLGGERIALVGQDALSSLDPSATIGNQIAELFTVHRGMRKKKALARAAEMLSLAGIPSASERLNHYPHQFSGGMRQRVLIAMALALEPDILVADEPTTALDATVKAQIAQLLLDLRARFGMSMLLVTHDIGIVARLADTVMVMYGGYAMEQGRVVDLLGKPAHPYTAALLDAVPRLDRYDRILETIPGTPPVPSMLPEGCVFHTRCVRAEKICSHEAPADGAEGVAHLVRCHFPLVQTT